MDGGDPGSAEHRDVPTALTAAAGSSAAYVELAADLMAGPAWQWVVRTDSLDLYAIEAPLNVKSLEYNGRLTLIGGGEALHRARMALAADGFDVEVSHLPDADPRHLATLVSVGSVEVTDEAWARTAASESSGRPSDTIRGRYEVPRDAEELAAALVRAATSEGVGISVRQENGQMIAVLYGPDCREYWLRAGEAASAVRLEAARYGLNAIPTVAGRERPREPGEPDQPTMVNDRRRNRDAVPYVHLHITR